MAEARTNHTYYALRVRSDAVAPEWWAAAHARGADAPQPVRALLTGRTRVELSPEEAIRAIHRTDAQEPSTSYRCSACRDERTAVLVGSDTGINSSRIVRGHAQVMFDTWLGREHAREPVRVGFVTWECSFAESCGPRMHEVAESEFARRGIDGHTSRRLVEVREHEAAFAEGRTEPFDLLVTSPPHAPAIRPTRLPITWRRW
jgi:hypothetical protein